MNKIITQQLLAEFDITYKKEYISGKLIEPIKFSKRKKRTWNQIQNGQWKHMCSLLYKSIYTKLKNKAKNENQVLYIQSKIRKQKTKNQFINSSNFKTTQSNDNSDIRIFQYVNFSAIQKAKLDINHKNSQWYNFPEDFSKYSYFTYVIFNETKNMYYIGKKKINKDNIEESVNYMGSSIPLMIDIINGDMIIRTAIKFYESEFDLYLQQQKLIDSFDAVRSDMFYNCQNAFSERENLFNNKNKYKNLMSTRKIDFNIIDFNNCSKNTLIRLTNMFISQFNNNKK